MPGDTGKKRVLLWRFLDRAAPHLSDGRGALGRVSVRDDFPEPGRAVAIDSNGWRNLAARLVEIDLALEQLDGWATRPEDVDELKRLEELRDLMQEALASKHLSPDLRDRLEERSGDFESSPTVDPRD